MKSKKESYLYLMGNLEKKDVVTKTITAASEDFYFLFIYLFKN